MRPARGAALLAVILSLGGCAALPPPMAADAAAQDGYRLGAGDKVRITVFNETTLTGEYSVTPTGSIAFPLVGDIPARDASIEDIQRAITTKLAGGYVNDPRVSVEILTFRPYYVLGEVNRPGEYPYVAGITVEQAVAAAGGYTYRANKRILFVRRARADERSVDLRGAAVSVLPGDTIRIGERYL